MTVSLPKFTIRELMEAGVHFGHKKMRWNPKVAPYIYGERNGIHIIDLRKSAPMLMQAMQVLYQVVNQNGRVLFVGTKAQASQLIAEAAKKCGQYYVNYRWLGGMLTNWKTISTLIKSLEELETKIAAQAEFERMEAATANDDNADATDGVEDKKDGAVRYTKKELLNLTRRRDKLELSLGGIRNMGGMPDLIIVFDVNKDSLAVKEANKLGIPIIGIIDTNSDIDGIDYIVPGNDDATRAIEIYANLFANSALAGIQDSLVKAGVDLGAIADFSQDSVAKALADVNQTKKAPVKKKATKKATSKAEGEGEEGTESTEAAQESEASEATDSDEAKE